MRARSAVTLLWLAFVLGGCTVADTFAYRSVAYNLQAEDTKNQNLIINVVRAAYRRPLQFTDLTTITGQASGSVSANLTVPFAAIPSTAARIFTLGPGASVSGGPNFTVAVLNTKEFYQGILSPIQPQTVAYYLHAGYPRAVLLTLLISRIEYGPTEKPERVGNDVFSDATYEKFRNLLLALIKVGLDAEYITTTAVIGPPLFDEHLRDIKVLENLQSQEIKVVRHDKEEDATLPEQKKALAERGYYFQLETKKSSYRFCFDPAEFKAEKLAGYAGLLELLTKDGDNVTPLPSILCHASEADRRAGRGAPAPRPVPEAKQTVPLSSPKDEFVLSTRSVEGIIYYLGEIVRRQVDLMGTGFEPTVQTGRTYEKKDLLFKVSRAAVPDPSISASYDGHSYHVRVDPTGNDRSVQVMELVTQLLAQHNSAKDLPAPSVIPVISR